MKEDFYIGQIFDGIYPPEAAVWCNENNAMMQELEPENGIRRFEIVEIPEHIPTKEEQKENRANAYQQEIDPITSHISRLKDEEQTPEIEQEIEDLKQERDEKVEEIKARYPYPEES